MKIGDRVPFHKESCARFQNNSYNKDSGTCLFGNVVSYDKEMVCISYMCQLFFVSLSDVKSLMEEIKNK